MALSAAFVSALRAQFTTYELASMRRTATADKAHVAARGVFDKAIGDGADTSLAASITIGQMPSELLAALQTSTSRYSRWSDSVLWRASFNAYESRVLAARRAARTRSRRAIRSIRSDNPTDVRSFDGTMARVRDGGVGRYRAGFSGAYGMRMTERRGNDGSLPGKRRARSFTVELHVRYEAGTPSVMAAYADDWSADRSGAMAYARNELALLMLRYVSVPHDIVITETGSEPVMVPEVADNACDRAFAAAMSTSGDSSATSASVTVDPFAGNYAEFRAAIAQGFKSAGYMLAGSGAKSVTSYRNASPAKVSRQLWSEYRAWAVREALPAHSGRVDKRWNAAVVFLGELCTALGKASDADAREIAEEMSAGHMMWGFAK